MAVLYITEYQRMPLDSVGRIAQCGLEPALATQTVAIGASSAQSSAFSAQTTFIRVCSDAICSVAFGSSPTATTSTTRIAANSAEYFGVMPAHKIAVIANT